MPPLISHPAQGLKGTTSVPGDKSISLRALILGSLAVGETVVDGLLEGDDVSHTASALRALGATIERQSNGHWHVHGVGVGGMREPGEVLDLGNSGTGARLLAGVLATQPIVAQMTGDASLCARPMDRVIAPLRLMGADFRGRSGGRLPMTIVGTGNPIATEYHLPVASAQVKSAILLAGLNAPGTTVVVEPVATRDHTERLLVHFGAEVERQPSGGNTVIRLRGQPRLKGTSVTVPGDPSSAAFPLVAALITGDSQVAVTNVGVNPLRSGLFATLAEMGGQLSIDGHDRGGLEPVADITARSSRLRAIEVPVSRVPSMIDEFPILAVAAACADGITVMRGLSELRVKETDRLAAIEAGLKACGVDVEALDDGLAIHGRGRPPEGGAVVDARGDHRIAMAFLTLGTATKREIRIDDGSMIDTSFPGFSELMNRLGADMAAGTETISEQIAGRRP